jgi:hypothetical protein
MLKWRVWVQSKLAPAAFLASLFVPESHRGIHSHGSSGRNIAGQHRHSRHSHCCFRQRRRIVRARRLVVADLPISPAEATLHRRKVKG